MSTLSALDAMVLRETVYPPLTTKAAELTFAEWDQRVIDMYAAIHDIVSGGNVEAYNPATVYDSTSSDPYLKFAGYNSRIWQAVFAGTFSGQTPAEGVYWTQITLAQMLPNVLKLVEVGNGIVSGSKRVKLNIPSAEVLALNSTPKAFGITVPAGYYIQPLSLQFRGIFNSSPYSSNTDLELRYVGATTLIADMAGLITFASNTVQNVLLNAAFNNVIVGADLEITETTGNPSGGDSDIDLYLTYMLIAI